jgi:hypothetical protein
MKRNILILCSLLVLSTGILTTFLAVRPSSRAASGTSTSLSVFVGYAEDKETNTPRPGTFPVPWAGSPNIIFLGNPIKGHPACGKLTRCYDAGAIRFDNHGSSNVTITHVSVDVHSSVRGGKVYSLWGSFTVPAGKSVILTQNPPGNNPNKDNFDTSSTPNGNCTPIKVAPTITISIGGVSTTLVDRTHVLDTGGIDLGSCHPGTNESIQWHKIGTL